MKTDLFQSCGHCWVFKICWHIVCSTLTASSFRILNSSAGIPSPLLALFVIAVPKAHCLGYRAPLLPPEENKHFHSQIFSSGFSDDWILEMGTPGLGVFWPGWRQGHSGWAPEFWDQETSSHWVQWQEGQLYEILMVFSRLPTWDWQVGLDLGRRELCSEPWGMSLPPHLGPLCQLALFLSLLAKSSFHSSEATAA